MDDDRLVSFLHELGQLRRLPRSGWRLAGVSEPESVAEHSLRAAQLAYFLAALEGNPRPERVATMVVFHDMAETRTTDLDRVAARYVERDEPAAVRDQTAGLGSAGEALRRLWEEVETGSTPDAILAKDADRLELVLTAVEYRHLGHAAAQDWIDNARGALRTAAGRRLFEAIVRSDPTAWWRGLKVGEDPDAG